MVESTQSADENKRLLAFERGYQNLGIQVDQFYDRILSIENQLLSEPFDKVRALTLISSTNVALDAARFADENRKYVYGLRSEVMRRAITSSFEAKSFIYDSDEGPFVSDALMEWARKLLLLGYEEFKLDPIVHTDSGELVLSNDYVINTITKLAKINKYRYFQSLFLDKMDIEGYLRESSGQEITNFFSTGTATFADMVTSSYLKVRSQGVTKERTLQILENSCEDDGFFGQMMRVGPNNVNLFISKYIDENTKRFKSRAPVLIWFGKLVADIPYLHELTNIVGHEVPSKLRQRSAVPCPANSQINFPGEPQDSEEDKILKIFIRRMINAIA